MRPFRSTLRVHFLIAIAGCAAAPVDAFDFELTSDVRPGPESSSPELKPGTMRNGEPVIYFSANVGAAGRQLWRTDGTDAGTVGLSVVPIEAFQPVAGGGVFAIASTPQTGRALFRSDGTSWELAWDPVEGPDDGLPDSALWPFGDGVVVRAVNQGGLWQVGWGFPPHMVSSAGLGRLAIGTEQGILVFGSPTTPAFVFGGATGTGRLLTVEPGHPGLPAGLHVAAAGGTTLCGKGFVPGGSLGEFHCADPSRQRIHRVMPAGFGSSIGLTDDPQFFVFGQRLAFVGVSPTRHLWMSDGTDAGTVVLADAPAAQCVSADGESAVFFERDRSLWMTTDAPGSSRALVALESHASFADFRCGAGKLATSWHRLRAAAVPGGLVVTDGSPGGTRASWLESSSALVRTSQIVVLHGALFVTAFRSDVGEEVFRLPWPDLLDSSFEGDE